MWRLNRALKPDGVQYCCIPILPKRRYEESLEPLERGDAEIRFGQFDHVRRFGSIDIQNTLGMIFDLPKEYDLSTIVPVDKFLEYGIPEKFGVGGLQTRF